MEDPQLTIRKPHGESALLPILFEDAEAIVIDKPAGLAVDAPRDGSASLAAQISALRLGFARDPAPVHRLDRDTSGCLLLARNPKALKRFGAAFEARMVGKYYVTIVNGKPSAEAGKIDAALTKVSNREAGWRIIVDPKGKPAVTHWRVLDSANGRSLLLLTPETGRTHQLRVHCASGLGLPIVGDPVYGRPDPAGLMLHAWRLEVERTGKGAIVAEAPLPARFVEMGFAEVRDAVG